MKFSFDDLYKEDSFLKSRVDALDLSDSVKNKFIKKSIRTVRGLLNLAKKEFKKVAGSPENVLLVNESLDKLALEIQLTEKVRKSSVLLGENNFDFNNPEDQFLPESLFTEDEDIIDVFAQYFGVDRQVIVSGARQQELVHIRDLIVCILREYADMSFPAIGRLLGGRDHTTIIYSYEKLKNKFKSDEKLRSGLKELILKAETIKERKLHIKEKLIPNLIASIREKQTRGLSLNPIGISERNLKVLELYREGLTLQQLGKTFGITRERARQIAGATIKQIAFNESLSQGIEFNVDILLEEEKKKRIAIKNKSRIVKIKPIKEKRWSRYYIACKSCGTTTIPHKRHGFCQKCSRQYGEEMRDDIISQHSNVCDVCNILHSVAIREYGRDFYITKTKQVLCRKCFLLKTGKSLGASRIKNKPKV